MINGDTNLPELLRDCRGAGGSVSLAASIPMHFRLVIFLSGCCALGLVGCGSGGPGTYPVSGRVTFADGSPLTKGVVVFASPSGNARGSLDEEGRYVLGTVTTTDGAAAGSYRIFLAGPIFEDSKGNATEYSENLEQSEALVDVKFSDPTNSGLTCEVTGRTTFDFTVSKP